MTHVLLIEDNLSVLESIGLELEMRGYGVSKALDGQEALNNLNNSSLPPDIIVSDIAMPNLDGYQLLEQIQQDERWNGIPFIYLTAFSSPNAIRIGKELGADDYLTKPFQADDLVVAIENKLKRIAQFQRSAERRLDGARKELLQVVSHELRTPLTAIYGGAEMLAESVQNMNDPMAERMLELVQSGAKRMNRLVNQILQIVEIDAGVLKQQIEKHAQFCDLVAVVQYACDLVMQQWEPGTPKADLAFDVPDEPIWVKGVQEFLVNAAAEVVRNALTFSPLDEMVTVAVQHNGSQACITVIDHGIGIAPEDVHRVWERFVQINRDQVEQQGIGLGLALTGETIRLHGGSCTIDSQPWQETTVSLCLPLAARNGT